MGSNSAFGVFLEILVDQIGWIHICANKCYSFFSCNVCYDLRILFASSNQTNFRKSLENLSCSCVQIYWIWILNWNKINCHLLILQFRREIRFISIFGTSKLYQRMVMDNLLLVHEMYVFRHCADIFGIYRLLLVDSWKNYSRSIVSSV